MYPIPVPPRPAHPAPRRAPRPGRRPPGRSPPGRWRSHPTRPARHPSRRARAGLTGHPERACVASSQPVTWFASACGPPAALQAFGHTEFLKGLEAAADAVPQYPGLDVQQQPDVRPGVCLHGLHRAPQPSPGLGELPGPHHRASQLTSASAITGSVPQPCRSASAIASRQRRWVVANGGPSTRTQAGEAPFHVRSATLPGQRGTLPQVTFGVRQRQRPCLNGPQVHQRHRSQVAVQRDVLIRLPSPGART